MFKWKWSMTSIWLSFNYFVNIYVLTHPCHKHSISNLTFCAVLSLVLTCFKINLNRHSVQCQINPRSQCALWHCIWWLNTACTWRLAHCALRCREQGSVLAIYGKLYTRVWIINTCQGQNIITITRLSWCHASDPLCIHKWQKWPFDC